MSDPDPWRCADDRVVSIDVTERRQPAAPLNARRWGPDEHVTVVSATTASGLRATTAGRAHGGMPADVIGAQVRWCAAAVTGRPLSGHRSVLAELAPAVSRQYVSAFAPALIDALLWDLRAQSLATSVAALIASRPAPWVETYASLPVVTEPDEAARLAATRFAAGSAGVKVHTSASTATDIDVVEAVAEAADGRGFVAYDAAGRLTRDDAARLGAVLDRHGARWFEEPFGPWDLDGFRWLRERCAVPLAGFETAPGGTGAVRLVTAAGGPHLLAVDCYWKGGVTGVLDAVAAARAAGLGVVMHHGATPELDALNVHVAAALGTGPVEAMPVAGTASRPASARLRPGAGSTVDAGSGS